MRPSYGEFADEQSVRDFARDYFWQIVETHAKEVLDDLSAEPLTKFIDAGLPGYPTYRVWSLEPSYFPNPDGLTAFQESLLKWQHKYNLGAENPEHSQSQRFAWVWEGVCQTLKWWVSEPEELEQRKWYRSISYTYVQLDAPKGFEKWDYKIQSQQEYIESWIKAVKKHLRADPLLQPLLNTSVFIHVKEAIQKEAKRYCNDVTRELKKVSTNGQKLQKAATRPTFERDMLWLVSLRCKGITFEKLARDERARTPASRKAKVKTIKTATERMLYLLDLPLKPTFGDRGHRELPAKKES